VTALADEFPRRLIARVTGWPRSSLYHEPRERADAARLDAAIQNLAGAWPTYGYRRITAMLRRDGWRVNGKRVLRAMARLGLAAKPHPRKPRTTHSDHNFQRFPNRVSELTVAKPDEVWVADITYVKLQRDFVYLAVLMDVFTRQIRGWELSRSLEGHLTIAALDRALRHGTPQIHHSDQGVQYAATDYVERLTAHRVSISMAHVGCPEENGYAERLMRTIKEEEVALSDYQDFADARRQLGTFLDDVYNRKRIHSALGYLTPAEFADDWHEQHNQDLSSESPSRGVRSKRGPATVTPNDSHHKH
jgi:putative transposase